MADLQDFILDLEASGLRIGKQQIREGSSDVDAEYHDKTIIGRLKTGSPGLPMCGGGEARSQLHLQLSEAWLSIGVQY